MGRSRSEKIKSYTTFGIGGEVGAIVSAKNPEALVLAVKSARTNKTPYVIIAGGSNVVFPDRPYRGTVIVFCDSRKLNHTCHCQGDTLTVSAGIPLAELIKCAIKNNLAGLEALSGIPGTVGGAVVGNAGAYGQSISDHLVAVEVFNPNVKHSVFNISKKQCKFAYRDSIFKHKEWIVLRAKFKLEPGDGKALAKKSREIIKTRNAKYTPGLKCPGSFFKNVLVGNIRRSDLRKIDPARIISDKIPAGYLLSEVGAKGMREGGIFVADFHGNLLINDGTGTYADVKKLARKLKQKVFKKFGIRLEEEVRYMDK